MNKLKVDKRKLNVYMYLLYTLLFGDTSNFDEKMKKQGIITSTLYYNFLDILITENELYCNYENLITEEQRKSLSDMQELNKYIHKKILADILYDFIFDIKKIKEDLINATDFFEEEYSKNKSIRMYKLIKQVFANFEIDYYENIIKENVIFE